MIKIINVGNTTIRINSLDHKKYSWATQDSDGRVDLWIRKPETVSSKDFQGWCRSDFDFENSSRDDLGFIEYENKLFPIVENLQWEKAIVKIGWLRNKLDEILNEET